MDGKRHLTVSAIQITAIDGEKAATVDKMAGWLDVAGGRGSDLVVLPELWTGLGFSEKGLHEKIAEPFPGPTTEMLADKAIPPLRLLALPGLSHRTGTATTFNR